ncbi:MAG: isoleucine--tRNA ligase [Thermoproteales archaeon]|nr:isoleucine--tRNA ligase [Thermoproteales archaeon]
MAYVGVLDKKYDPHKVEEKVKKFWRDNRIYDKLRNQLRGRPKFYFLDGPPYPSSDVIHVGTGWNKVLKDVVVRFRRMQGFNVRDQPGYDCHGLPIELAVEKKFGFHSKKDIEEYGVEKFVRECEKLALHNSSSISRQFEDLGVSLDWKNPYLTLNKDYLESAWWIVKRAHEKGLLEKGLKVLHWCPRCETVLADYEVSEYKDLEDPSIYVKFPLEGEDKKYIVIWTTTPWTLPSNVGVMVHPDFDYVEVEVNGEILILAKERLEPVFKEIGLEYRVLRVFKGRELEGLRYKPPLAEEVPAQREVKGAHRVVLSPEYVNLEEGSGCVHMATGHGMEDYEVGLKNGLPLLLIVDERGRFTDKAGKYAGKPVREANKEIVEDLRRKGLLLYATRIVHKYPVCWRCKTPLILRATEQWFIAVTKLKEDFIREAEKVNWIPSWAGTSRFRNWIQGLRDWVITRQRYWGTPAPIWVCRKCGFYEVLGSLKELAERNPEAEKLEDLHRPWIDEITYTCPKCGGVMKRIPDVLDVWLDSGVAFYASLGYPNRKKEFEYWWPVDFIVEGHDQISGWFYSLLRSGLICFDQTPYKTVLMHGFALDEKGREMHKSLGNFVSVSEALKYGRDAFRLAVLSNTVWEDLKFSWRRVEEALSDLNIMWNVYVFASTYMNLDRFHPSKADEQVLKSLKPEDYWILARLQSLIEEVTINLENYNINVAMRLLRNFILEDVSRRYIRFIRRRVWIEENHPDKLSAYFTLYRVLKTFLQLAAPFLPFVTEAIYQDMFRGVEDGTESIHMLPWPRVEDEYRNPSIEREMSTILELLEAGLSLRMQAGVKLRQPLPSLMIFTDDSTLITSVTRFRNLLEDQLNVKEVLIKPPMEYSNYVEMRVEPILSKLGPLFREKALAVAEALRNKKGKEVVEELEKKHRVIVNVEGREVEVDPSCIKLVETLKEGFLSKKFGNGMLILNISVSERERTEGLARDLVRRIQFMRKEMDLPVDAFIEVKIYINREDAKALEEFKDYIAGEVRAKNIHLKPLEEQPPREGYYTREWKIDDEQVIILIRKL